MMNKFFLKRLSTVSTSGISVSQIEEYRRDLVAEMKKQGASDNELMLIHEATIINSIRSNRQPEEVAWAILQ